MLLAAIHVYLSLNHWALYTSAAAVRIPADSLLWPLIEIGSKYS